MKNICQTCNEELETAHTFKLKCDKLNYEDGDRVPKQVLCELCGKTFKNAESLDQHHDGCRKNTPIFHTQTQHQSQTKPMKKAEAVKPKCNAAQGSLKFKISTNKENIWKVEKIDKAMNPIKSDENGLVCPYCKYRFVNTSGLGTHMSWHKIRKNKFKCSKCALSFINEIHLRNHDKHDH